MFTTKPIIRYIYHRVMVITQIVRRYDITAVQEIRDTTGNNVLQPFLDVINRSVLPGIIIVVNNCYSVPILTHAAILVVTPTLWQ